MGQKLYTVEEARQVIDRSARLQNIRKSLSINLTKKLTRDELVETGMESGLDPKFIEMAIQELHEVRRQSFSTDTHLIEEAEIKNSAGLEQVWREVISELKYRMKGSPEIKSTKNKNEWIFEDRSGVKTLVSLSSPGNGIKLHLSRSIGFATASVESLVGAGILSFIVFGYFFVFLGTSLFDGILISLAVLFASFFVFKKMNLSRRRNKRRRFRQLTEHVIEQILYLNRRGEEEN